MVQDEIEVKYLLYEKGTDYTKKDFLKLYDSIEDLVNKIDEYGKKVTQGYLSDKVSKNLCDELNIKPEFEPKESRLRKKVDKYYFTLKGKGKVKRKELEREIDKEIFEKYFENTKGNRVMKLRFKESYRNYEIEFDKYINRDLIVAEIEIDSENELKLLPKLGKDIKDDNNYKNRNLAK